MAKKKKSLLKNKRFLMLMAIICACVGIFVLFGLSKIINKPGKQSVSTVSTLEKVVKSSSLSTYETVYNGVAAVYNEKKPDKVDYYVSYEATVKAGLDFNMIEISNDEENLCLTVSLPPVTLQEPTVQIQNMDYIFVNKKVNQDAISAQAYKVSIEDARAEAEKQDAIIDYAQKNAEKLIKGLISPFISQLDEEYEIKFEWRD